jgi:hypothetical protein
MFGMGAAKSTPSSGLAKTPAPSASPSTTAPSTTAPSNNLTKKKSFFNRFTSQSKSAENLPVNLNKKATRGWGTFLKGPESKQLKHAAKHGKSNNVRFLLEKSKFTEEEIAEAIFRASKYRHPNTLDFLLEDKTLSKLIAKKQDALDHALLAVFFDEDGIKADSNELNRDRKDIVIKKLLDKGANADVNISENPIYKNKIFNNVKPLSLIHLVFLHDESQPDTKSENATFPKAKIFYKRAHYLLNAKSVLNSKSPLDLSAIGNEEERNYYKASVEYFFKKDEGKHENAAKIKQQYEAAIQQVKTKNSELAALKAELAVLKSSAPSGSAKTPSPPAAPSPLPAAPSPPPAAPSGFATTPTQRTRKTRGRKGRRASRKA